MPTMGLRAGETRPRAEDERRPRLHGRPTTEPRHGEKTTLSVRASPQLKARLLDAMKASGRSLSEEAEMRLEMSFKDDRAEAALREVLARLPPVGSR